MNGALVAVLVDDMERRSRHGKTEDNGSEPSMKQLIIMLAVCLLLIGFIAGAIASDMPKDGDPIPPTAPGRRG